MALGGLLGGGVPRRLLGRPEAQELAVYRLPWLVGICVFWAFLIFCRLIWLQGVKRDHYRREAQRQHLVRVPVPAVRGELRDRKGASLAISLKAESLFCTPHLDFYPNYKGAKKESEAVWGEPDRKAAQKLAHALSLVLGSPSRVIQEKLLRKKRFVFIERQLTADKVAEIKSMKLEGAYFLPESKRQYPRQTLACQILGFTDIDGIGQLGIERTYHEQLAGKDGEMVAPKDAKGRLLMLQENFTKIPVNGSTLQLTIDSTIQHLTEKALEEAFKLASPLTAYAVVVDPNTGEILAMAGTPVFDPNFPVSKKFRNRSPSEFSPEEKEEYKAEMERQKAARKVHPLENAYEPGSTMKIFTAAMALEERKVRLGEKINCEGGGWRYHDKVITDTHNYGLLTFEEILWKSSNIGTAKIGLRIDPVVHYQYLRKFGFGEKSGLNFPGESAGRLLSPDQWSATTQPTLCYGYGLSTTPLQILMAGCALANGGRLMQPYLVQKVYNDQGVVLQENRPKVRSQVLSEETSAMMRETLKGVISDQGTARRAALDGGVIAFGKTGTSRKLVKINEEGKLGYDPKKHYSSFMGFFPADKPEYAVLVMLDEPGRGLTGGDVAAPLYKQIGDGILRYQARGNSEEQEPDLKLTLKDWPVSENDEAVIHLESGKVPPVTGLALKAAIHRVVLSGGIPKIEGGEIPEGPSKVLDQSPPAGSPLEAGSIVTLKLRAP